MGGVLAMRRNWQAMGEEAMKFEVDQVCHSCKGTGIYVGMAEHHGAGVVCSYCSGTGMEHFVHEYERFVTRKGRKDIRRVYQVNPGIGIGERAGVCSLEDFGGMPFRDWASGKPFPAGSEDRRHTCPAWWYQSANYKLKPQWTQCSFGRFSECGYFKDKAACWRRWDMENKKP
jgi:hypothetical protein